MTVSSIYKIKFDQEALKKWLSGIKMDAVNALLPAVDDGLFEKYITTEKILDIKLAAHNRTAIVPLASLA